MNKKSEQSLRYVHPNSLLASLKQLGRPLSITHGSYYCPSQSERRDLDWNHMDQSHRPYIHNTYHHSVRLVTGADFAISLTRLKFLGFPIFVLVNDTRIEPHIFYQHFTLFGLFYVHNYIRSEPDRVANDWYIVSHPIFKFLHGWLNRRLCRLNAVQNKEDEVIRDRRIELRSKGFSFASDEPDFLNSNQMSDNVIPPPFQSAHRISISSLSKQTELQKIIAGPIELLIRRNSDNSVSVWTEHCPHEGASLQKGKCLQKEIQCSWHGLKIPCAHLDQNHPKKKMWNLEFSLEGDDLVIAPRI